ncbi:unnamed protein product [Callosobruchus maculatus]|nr:unnamed protein product [Callosobruchus maculatus]
MSRDMLDTELTAMAGESYQRAYGAMVQVQMLSELEEVMQYKLVPERRPTLKEMWWQRLQAGQRLVEDWQKIIQVHSLVLEPHEDIHTWLKYAALCRKSGSMRLSHKTLVMLLGYDPEDNPQLSLPHIMPHVTFAYTKHLWAIDQKVRAFRQLEQFLNEYTQQAADGGISTEERNRLLARCYLKLGGWQESLEGVSETSINYILNCYQQATEYDKDWYKAWHSWAYMNFETVLFYKNKEESDKSKLEKSPQEADKNLDLNKHTVLAVQGFFK